MFDWLKSLFKSSPAETPPPPQLPRNNSIFSTNIFDKLTGNKTTAGDYLAERFRQLQSIAPIRAPIDGAMDEQSQGSLSEIKSAYSANIPNLSDAIIGFFLSQGFIGHQLAAMLATHWLIDKACTIPAKDAVRKGYEIVTLEGEKIKIPQALRRMQVLDKRYKINKNMIQFVRKGRTFGIRIAFFKVASNDKDYYEKPFNIDSVGPGSYRGIVQVDPYWCAPILDGKSASDSDSMHFYEPTWWLINNKKYHRSHLVIFREGDVADILKPSYLYGGVPVPQRIVERVYAAERTANEAPQLAMTKRTTVLTTDVEKLLAAGPDTVSNLEVWAALRDNYGVKVVGDDEKVEQFDTALAELDDVIMSQYQIVAAAAGVPATKLLETSPKGFNATGDYEEASYHESLESIQTEDLTPMLDRHHLIMMRSDIVPYMRRIDPKFVAIETTVTWLPLDSMTAEEKAKMNLDKSTTALNYQNAGAIDGYDIRENLINDRDSGFTGIDSIERPDQPEKEPEPKAPDANAQDSADDIKLISNQTYLDPLTVAEKRLMKDYDVQVSGLIVDPRSGQRYRIVLDGHHSLAAARLDGVAPNIQESEPTTGDYNEVGI